MQKIMVVAPHPDDETIGCGGALLKHVNCGDEIHWLIVTTMQAEQGYSTEQMLSRTKEIQVVAREYGFKSTNILSFPAARLDELSAGTIIEKMYPHFTDIKPQVV